MKNQGLVSQATLDSLLEENVELHQLIHLTRKQTISMLMAFIHINAETAIVPSSWLLGYILNDDKSILDCANTDEWPAGYEKKVNDFCEMMTAYNGESELSLPMREVVEDMAKWPYPANQKDNLH